MSEIIPITVPINVDSTDTTIPISMSCEVQPPSDPPTGTKTIDINQNGTTTEDVASFAFAEINTAVPQIQQIILRPDAELVQSWTYDKRIVADEGVTLPAYTTVNQTLKATEQLDEITADVDHYRYYVTARSLVIPEYNTTNTGRGRFEWSSMIASHGFVFTPMAELHPLIDGEYTIATNSAAVQGGASYRGLYFTSATGISIYATTTYGIWTSYAAPTYVIGKMRISSPSLTMRGQPNILDEPYWEALTDIRFQYIIEMWRVPIDSLGYSGWQEQQSIDKALDCLYSPSHKLL